jgi:hypothetical protein
MRRRNVCLILTPPPVTSIYMGWATSWEQLGHPGIHCRTNHQAPRGSRWQTLLRSVWPIQGVGRPRPTASRVVLSPSDWYVVPYDGSRCPGYFEAVCLGCGPLNPCAEHMVASDLSGSASLGLMRCHGHMASYVPPGPQDVLCTSLSSGLRCMHMIYPFRSSWWARYNGVAIWHLRLFMMMPYLCHWFTCS